MLVLVRTGLELVAEKGRNQTQLLQPRWHVQPLTPRAAGCSLCLHRSFQLDCVLSQRSLLFVAEITKCNC